MIGAVVQQELLIGSRRNRLRIFWCLYLAWLVGQVFVYFWLVWLTEQQNYWNRAQYAWMSQSQIAPVTPDSAPHLVGALFVPSYAWQLFVILAIATPALVAGAITDEKRRGTLQYLMLTDLSTRSLLLGKLIGRVIQVGSLALLGVPLLVLLGGFGGVTPLNIVAVLILAPAAVFALSAASLLASVWCRQTRDAVLALYGVGIAIGVVVWQVGDGLEVLSPFWVLDSVNTLDADEIWRRLALTVLTWILAGTACLGLAIWRVKPAYLRELESTSGKRATWYRGRRVAINDEPVRWRERNVEGLAPIAGLRRIPAWLAITLLFVASSASSFAILAYTAAPDTRPEDVLAAIRRVDIDRLSDLFPAADRGFLAQGVLVALLGSLVVGIRCSGAVTGERERQTWEPLLLTPLTPRQLIRGKLWGIMGASYGYLFAYGFPAILLSIAAGPLALVWTLLWLGVTLLAMYFVGSAGLYSSVRSKSSWQALLKTLGLGYLFAALINGGISLVIWIGLFMVVLLLAAVDVRLRTAFASSFLKNLTATFNLVFFAICVGMAIGCWFMSKSFLSLAERSIAERERTRHWHSAPVYRRSKRRLRRVGSRARGPG
jgi:ABC-type transport system involved in multi-copper enzyme maturation permease subunit